MPLLLFFVPYSNFPVCFLSLLFLLFLPFCLFPFLLLVFCSSAKPLLNPRTIRGFCYTKKGIGLLPIPLFSPSRERRLFSRSFRPRAARSPLARDFLPDAVGKSSGVRIRERRSFFSFHGFYDSSLPSAIPKSYPR